MNYSISPYQYTSADVRERRARELEYEKAQGTDPVAGSPHYYGNIVRRFFVAAAVIILLGSPIFVEYLPRPLITSIFAVIVFILVAGFLNPGSFAVALVQVSIAMAAMAVFQFYAIYTFYRLHSYADPFFLASQILSVLFLAGFYYSTKTVRSMVLPENDDVSPGEKVIKVLLQFGKKRGDIKEIFWGLVSGGASEEDAAHIITNPGRLMKYLSLLKHGSSNTEATHRILSAPGHA